MTSSDVDNYEQLRVFSISLMRIRETLLPTFREVKQWRGCASLLVLVKQNTSHLLGL